MINRTKLLPPVWFLTALLVMIGLHFWFPLLRIIPAPWDYLGLIFLFLGLATIGTCARSFRKAETTIKPFEESTTLVMNGFFAISRNPIYLGMVLILIGTAVLVGTLSPWFVIPFFAFWIDYRFIRAEEIMLEQTFGEHYRDYKAKVRRWI